jgi:hypothetical protein
LVVVIIIVAALLLQIFFCLQDLFIGPGFVDNWALNLNIISLSEINKSPHSINEHQAIYARLMGMLVEF